MAVKYLHGPALHLILLAKLKPNSKGLWVYVQKTESQAFPLTVPSAAPCSLRLWTSSERPGCTRLPMARGPGQRWESALLPGLASSSAGLPEVDSGKKRGGGKKKTTQGEKKKKEKAGGCPAVEVASLMLCWSTGQIPQCLLDSFSNQFPLNSAGAPFGSGLQELPSPYLKLGENLQKETIQVVG